MTDLRQELLDVFVGRAARRYGLSGDAVPAATPDFDHSLRRVEGCREQ